MTTEDQARLPAYLRRQIVVEPAVVGADTAPEVIVFEEPVAPAWFEQVVAEPPAPAPELLRTLPSPPAASPNRTPEDRPAPRKGGRPSLSGDASGMSPAIGLRLPADLRAEAAALAAAEGKTLSALAREALEAYVEARRTASDDPAQH